MFRICFVWVYIIKGFCPFSKLASIGRLCLAYIFTLVGDCSPVCPKSFYIKGNKTAFKGFIVVQFFTTMCRPFVFIKRKAWKD